VHSFAKIAKPQKAADTFLFAFSYALVQSRKRKTRKSPLRVAIFMFRLSRRTGQMTKEEMPKVSIKVAAVI